MDFGPWVQTIMASSNTPIVAAFLIGLLASLGPCPLATNISALGYLSKEVVNPRRVLLTSALYTLGRTLSYGVLGLALFTAGWQINRVSNNLQTLAEIALGPLLILVGLVLFDLIHLPVRMGGAWMEQLSRQLADWDKVGAFSLGALFALSFCPYSAALYFGVLMPLAFKSVDGWTFPFSFGIGTSVPVIVIGVPLALGVMKFAAAFNMLARVERVMRKTAALAFIGAGAFTLWSWIASIV